MVKRDLKVVPGFKGGIVGGHNDMRRRTRLVSSVRHKMKSTGSVYHIPDPHGYIKVPEEILSSKDSSVSKVLFFVTKKSESGNQYITTKLYTVNENGKLEAYDNVYKPPLVCLE